jgi:hypothetical protein
MRVAVASSLMVQLAVRWQAKDSCDLKVLWVVPARKHHHCSGMKTMAQ